MPGRLSRRQMLGVLIGGAAIFTSSRSLAEAVRDICLMTPLQTEGPYYPVHDQLDKDNDLTLVEGRSGRATGQVIYIRGRTRDAACRPIDGALVEIWQASANGRYNHPRDRGNRLPLDPYFQYWGKARTDREGRYLFKTIMPGRYQAGPGWTRPAHVHFKVHRPGMREMTTQMYFAGDPFHETDSILNDVPSAERSRVIVELEAPDREYEPEAKVCRFDLIL
jgi:protocatechuate 3,4-dioxygenase beta subunit